MATTTKKQQPTWENLQQRGGPYTFAELRTLYSRPGMAPVGDTAWHCDTCGRIIGTYSSTQLDAFYRERGTFTERQSPTPPQLVRDLEAHLMDAENLLREINADIEAAYTERAKADRDQRNAEEAARSGRFPTPVDPKERASWTARRQYAEMRIAELKAAREEALRTRNEASDAYIVRFAEWRAELLQAERRAHDEAAGLAPDPDEVAGPLARWLARR